MFVAQFENGQAHGREPALLAEAGRFFEVGSKGVFLSGPVVSKTSKEKRPVWEPPVGTSEDVLMRASNAKRAE